jgi:phosphatidylglycerophosphate synthase
MLLVLPFVCIIHDILVYKCTKNLFLSIIFIVIITSDILDGFLARKLKCTSNVGVKLDIISDAFHTILSLFIFVYFKIIPAWFIILLVLKLFEFILFPNKMRLSGTYRFNNMKFFRYISLY